jgi:hypothetical protein
MFCQHTLVQRCWEMSDTTPFTVHKRSYANYGYKYEHHNCVHKYLITESKDDKHNAKTNCQNLYCNKQ